MKSFAQLEHISIMVTQEKKPGSRGSDSEEGSLIVDDVQQEVHPKSLAQFVKYLRQTSMATYVGRIL